MTTYSAVRTKAGREKLVKAVTDLANRAGVTLERDDYRPSEIYLCLTFGAYRCSMHFDGKEPINVFLGHWHIGSPYDATYPRDFGRTIGGSINEYHFAKATTCEATFEGFLASLERGFHALQAREDTAFAA